MWSITSHLDRLMISKFQITEILYRMKYNFLRSSILFLYWIDIYHISRSFYHRFFFGQIWPEAYQEPTKIRECFAPWVTKRRWTSHDHPWCLPDPTVYSNVNFMKIEFFDMSSIIKDVQYHIMFRSICDLKISDYRDLI